MPDAAFPAVYPTLHYDDVGAAIAWLTALGFSESWRNEEHGIVEHAEMRLRNGVLSLNHKRDLWKQCGPSGVAVRFDTRDDVDAMHAHREQGALA